ncbi:thiolase domain-containing protein [Thermoflavimicrobium dichotomicum]|uniref:Acetyl-CoA C-acetyltransferase n=1 Tax=Thermoflavimicrobium dichotomicum TaxID=46223 RepID=A0A1I3T843_9BACL|nr:thiolase domain-containing protein [Thermoflavimicrobium dichotomicum]SFJ66753.1 acetyl-CoA C-acetyltransferase [Thermoflavimicrobium dichotomicum]
MALASVIGVGSTRYGVLDSSFLELVIDAASQALRDAGIGPEDIDAYYLGNFAGENFINQNHLAAYSASAIGLNGVPATRVEGACASGSLAVREAILAIKSGLYKRVLVVGAEKMTSLDTSGVTSVLAKASNWEAEVGHGLTFPAVFAFVARRYMHQYGATREHLAAVAVKNHNHAMLNPKAHMQKKITLEEVLSCQHMVAEPLSRYDCSLISDGASAMVLCAPELAETHRKDVVDIVGTGQASGRFEIFANELLTSFPATRLAAKRAYTMANIKPDDVDVAELHDCFTIAEIVATEDLGFFKPGEGGIAALEGRTRLGGELPINPSGGLKAKGHPVGSTGVGQGVEVVCQLRGEAGLRQVKNAEIGLTHNLGGAGGTCTVHIYKRR